MKHLIMIYIMLVLVAGLAARADISIDTELAIAFPGYNDVRIPNDANHDMFSLVEDLSAKPVLGTRLQVNWFVHPRHRVSLLAAPLTISPKGSFDRNIRYQNETFLAGEQISATYRFDSYRLGYRYFFPKENMIIKAVGASLKLRDAEIALETTGKKATKTNTGFVPLLSLIAGYKLSDEIELELDAEGLGSPYGRAEDIYLGVNIDVNDKVSFRTGYRFLEGGSDIDEVYTFAAVHYASLGFRVKL